MTVSVSDKHHRDRAGIALALLAVVIWAGWLPATRVAVEDGLAPLDVAFLRYAVPAVILAPVWWRVGMVPRGVPVPVLLALFCWGAPFVFLISTALTQASVAHTAALVPCTMPVLAALGARVFYGERIPVERRIGIALIALAAMLVLGTVLAGYGGATSGTAIALLLLASAGWAAYSVAYRRSGLTAVEAAAVVFAWSTLALLPFILFYGTDLPNVPAPTLLFHAGVQGVLSGCVATIAYGLAITRLGVPRAASFSVLVPVLATLLAVFWLGEHPSMLDVLALGIGTLGVAVVNGVISPLR